MILHTKTLIMCGFLKVLGFQDLQEEEKFITDVDSWWIPYKEYTSEKTNLSSWRDVSSQEEFSLLFSDFLFSSHGARFKSMFKFGGKLECNKPAPQILASKFKLSWKLIELPEEHRPARETVKKEKNQLKNILILKLSFRFY